MGAFKHTKNPEVEAVFAAYPEAVRDKMEKLRAIVVETAEESPAVSSIEESLKWGEPSFKTNIGSTLRMDWKSKNPKQYAIYFQCTSRLVPTFRLVFDDRFQYEGNRAIVFQINDKLPMEELKECIKATLSYHKVKHLMTLGI